MVLAAQAEQPLSNDLLTIARFSELMVDLGDSPSVGAWLQDAGVFLRPSAFVLLRALEMSGPLTLTQLAENVGLQPSTVSLQLKPLTEKRYVSRRADRNDRRVAHLAISELGRKMCVSTREASAEEWRQLLAPWPLKDRQRLGAFLARVLSDSDEAIARERRHSPELEPLPPLVADKALHGGAEDYLMAIVRFCQRSVDVARTPSASNYMLKQVGMQLPQSAFVLLRRLEVYGPITVSKLADEIGLDQSTISQQMRPLVDKRLVKRTVDAEDRRIAHLVITAAGRRLCERVRAVGAEGWSDILVDWTLKERQELARLLGRALADSERIRQGRAKP